MKIFDTTLMQHLSAQAKANPRLRQNLNLHDNLNDPSQRLLNAMEPGSYIRPHRHLVHPKPEGFVAVSGRLALLTFDGQGVVTQVVCIGPHEPDDLAPWAPEEGSAEATEYLDFIKQKIK